MTAELGATKNNPVNSDILIDAKTRYNAAQSELNARLQIRNNINISHIVIIVAATGTYSAIKIEENQIFRSMITAAIPLITYYFITMYLQNDANISNIIRNISELEKLSDKAHQNLVMSSRFRHLGQTVARMYRLNISRIISVVGLCFISPVILVIDIFNRTFLGRNLIELKSTESILFYIVFIFCSIISLINAKRAYTALQMRN